MEELNLYTHKAGTRARVLLQWCGSATTCACTTMRHWRQQTGRDPPCWRYAPGLDKLIYDSCTYAYNRIACTEGVAMRQQTAAACCLSQACQKQADRMQMHQLDVPCQPPGPFPNICVRPEAAWPTDCLHVVAPAVAQVPILVASFHVASVNACSMHRCTALTPESTTSPAVVSAQQARTGHSL